jgi:hypothetical protein
MDFTESNVTADFKEDAMTLEDTMNKRMKNYLTIISSAAIGTIICILIFLGLCFFLYATH